MLHLFFKHAVGLLFPFTAIFMPRNAKMQHLEFEIQIVSIHIYLKNQSPPSTQRFTLHFRSLQHFFFFAKAISKGKKWLATACSERGSSSGEMSTLSPCINPLGSREHLHVCTSRTDKGGWSLTVRSACTHSVAEVSCLLAVSLMCMRVSRTSLSSHNELWCATLNAAALIGLANTSACNGGCQHYLDSIDQAPTWGQTIRTCLW